MSQKIIFCLVLSLILWSCSQPEPKMGDFKVLPSPQEFNVSGVSALKVKNIQHFYGEAIDQDVLGEPLSKMKMVEEAAKAQLVLKTDENLDMPAQGYELTIANEQITITGKDKAGLFYGCMTLKQLMEDAGEQQVNLPVATVKDYPLLAYRAVHLDVKHHLEKTDYYYKLMDKLAGYKVNAIILEAEDKIKFKRQPIVGSSDALSIEEWKKLSDYAHARHIEISPLVQGLGHASFILKHPEYFDLRDNPKSDWAFNPLDPKTYEVQFDLYLDAMEATPHGKYLHVGGDEVHTTGRDSGKSALELQLTWLDKVSKFAAEHDRIPIFWDDMPLKQAELYRPMFQPEMTQQAVDSIWEQNGHKLAAFLDQFPKNCIYMRWNYSSPQALGNLKAMDWFRDNGLQVMGATAGQTRWVLMPQEESNIENIKSFALNSIESGSHGLLLTLWDDDSPHFELYNRGIVFFSEYTWSGEKRSNDSLKTAYRQREFSHELADKAYAFIDSLEKPVIFWKNALLQGNKRNYLQTMDNAMDEGVIALPDGQSPGKWSETHASRLLQADQVVKQTDSIEAIIASAQSAALRNRYTLDVYEQVNKMTALPAKLLLGLQAYDKAESLEAKTQAMKHLDGLREAFTEQRKEFEEVYAKTRILNKPDNYILDSDHHVHLANQSINFDWQFYAEMLFFDKLSQQLENALYLENADGLKK